MQAGAAVTCACGQRWDTARLPEADLRGLDRLLARSRRNRAVFVATVLLAVVGLLIVGQSAPLPVTVLVFAAVWWRFCRPWWRQRRRSGRVSALPSWELRADEPPGRAAP